MDIPRQRPMVSHSASPLRYAASLALLTTGVAFTGVLCSAGDYRNAGVVTAVSMGAALLLAGSVTVEVVLLTWFVTTPLASFYLRYPLDRSILTYDRGVFGLLVVMLLLEGRRAIASSVTVSSLSGARTRISLSKFEVAWALLSILALASALAKSNDVAYAMRIAIDSFWLPLCAFYFARRHFDLRSGGRLLLIGCMALAIFLFATAAFELTMGIDLFRYKGAELVRAGERRVNGPFAADSSFAIICLMLFLFLRSAPRLLGARFDRTGKLLYGCATGAAALGALLPLFRTVALALGICWITLRACSRRDPGRWPLKRELVRGFLIAGIVIVLGGWLATMAPLISSGRLRDPRSAFGRLATWQAAAGIALENPAFGVGLANYADYYDASHYFSDLPPEEVLDTKAATTPHSNLLWIASELGLFGLALYIAANLYLFLMGWRAFKRAEGQKQRIAASCFLVLVLAYWIPGLTLASGYYSDLNIYFLFLLGAVSRQFFGAPAGSEQSPIHG